MQADEHVWREGDLMVMSMGYFKLRCYERTSEGMLSALTHLQRLITFVVSDRTTFHYSSIPIPNRLLLPLQFTTLATFTLTYCPARGANKKTNF